PLGVAIVRDRILEDKSRGATIVLNSHQLAEVERVCDRIAFIDRGRLTRTETLRGQDAAPRRGILRVPAGRAEQAAAALSAAGLFASPQPDGTLHLSAPREDDIARAVSALLSAGVPVLEARASADLEGLFRKADAS